jgi:hypothetical protein
MSGDDAIINRDIYTMYRDRKMTQEKGRHVKIDGNTRRYIKIERRRFLISRDTEIKYTNGEDIYVIYRELEIIYVEKK